MKTTVIVVLLIALVALTAVCASQFETIASLTAQRKAFVEYMGVQEMDGHIKLDSNTRLRLLEYSPEAEF